MPDALSSPNTFPADFFNANIPGCARGVVFTTPSTGFQVSANAANSPVEFGNIDGNYPFIFTTCSAQRLFTPINSHILDVNLFLPGSTTPAVTHGFGSVFSDVDLANITSIQCFDAADVLLGTFFAQNAIGNETLSFLGVSFDEPIISRVCITNRNLLLMAGHPESDFVVMEDFIFGEPVPTSDSAPVPESTTTLAALFMALAPLVAIRRRKRSA